MLECTEEARANDGSKSECRVISNKFRKKKTYYPVSKYLYAVVPVPCHGLQSYKGGIDGHSLLKFND